jgi:pyridoxamine 5'-phosphate oxidase
MSNEFDFLHNNYIYKELDISTLLAQPTQQFQKWFDEAITYGINEPYAMCLSTVGKKGKPSSRIVLLRGLNEQGFEFFTNYESRKGLDIQGNPYVSLNFLWLDQARQVRIEGKAQKLSKERSEEYYDSRPVDNKISAWTSPQSKVLKNRKELDKMFTEKQELFKNKEIPKPDFWGGYVVIPEMLEFWQGRENRLHDRFRYTLQKNKNWKIERLAP